MATNSSRPAFARSHGEFSGQPRAGPPVPWIGPCPPVPATVSTRRLDRSTARIRWFPVSATKSVPLSAQSVLLALPATTSSPCGLRNIAVSNVPSAIPGSPDPIVATWTPSSVVQTIR